MFSADNSVALAIAFFSFLITILLIYGAITVSIISLRLFGIESNLDYQELKCLTLSGIHCISEISRRLNLLAVLYVSA